MMSYQPTYSLIEKCQWDRRGHAIHSLQKSFALVAVFIPVWEWGSNTLQELQ